MTDRVSTGACQVFASDDCSKVLVAAQYTQLFLWQHDASQTYLDGQDHTPLGRWSRVVLPEGLATPGGHCPEACLHAAFSSSSVSHRFLSPELPTLRNFS